MSEQSTFNLSEPSSSVPVECLGLTFESESARRAHFLKLLAEKLKDPEFRKIEGFPIGEDADILALSDPPYYTACPNPWIGEFVRLYSKPYDPKVPYHREPFAADVSEGKYHPNYKYHPYPTKVPHRAIMRYILHYTEPGDLVFDGFCGTGMTGVAAQLCGDRKEVQELGYRVREDGTILNEEGKPFSKLGARRAILNDLSPSASYIAYSYNCGIGNSAFEKASKRIINEVKKDIDWMFTTQLSSSTEGTVNYVVLSDVFSCSECGGEIVFWRDGVDVENGKVKEDIICPICKSEQTKRQLNRAWETWHDNFLGQTIRRAKRIPVLLNYTVNKGSSQKSPDESDLKKITSNNSLDNDVWYPTNRMIDGDEGRRNDPIGLTHVHHFYSPRNLQFLAHLRQKITEPWLFVLLTKVAFQVTLLYRFTVPRHEPAWEKCQI